MSYVEETSLCPFSLVQTFMPLQTPITPFCFRPRGTEPVKDTTVLPAEPQGAAFLVHMCVPPFEEELPDVFPNVRTNCSDLWLPKTMCSVADLVVAGTRGMGVGISLRL